MEQMVKASSSRQANYPDWSSAECLQSQGIMLYPVHVYGPVSETCLTVERTCPQVSCDF